MINPNFINQTKEAAERILGYVHETPVEFAPSLGQKEKCKVFFKMEHFQNTGSFKIRGAANMILSLSDLERERGIIAASSGNHAAAVVHMLQETGTKGTLVLPENVSEAKVTVLHSSGVPLRFYGNDVSDTEWFARDLSEKERKTIIPPYNHPQIITGQATLGLELYSQIPNLNVVFIPVGGGGLASGVAGYLKAANKQIKVIGCQPKNSAVMYESVKAGRIVTMESTETLADGTAGGIEKDSTTFGYCQKLVDDFVLVSEEEIQAAILWMLQYHFVLIEGAAALSLAAYLKTCGDYLNKNIALLITGRKLSIKSLKKVLT